MLKKVMAVLAFVVPAVSMSLYGQTDLPLKSFHHIHRHHHCDSDKKHSHCEEFGYFYRESDQEIEDHERVLWSNNDGIHTEGVHVEEDSQSSESVNIIIKKRGIYLVQWVLCVEAEFETSPTQDVFAYFQLQLNEHNVPGGAYLTMLVSEESSDYRGQLVGQALLTVINEYSRLSLRNDSGFTVELDADELASSESSSPSDINVSASIIVQRLSDISL